ncbi:hypothetical protein SRHO_G00233740 [Serrasalmus rhombeus]
MVAVIFACKVKHLSSSLCCWSRISLFYRVPHLQLHQRKPKLVPDQFLSRLISSGVQELKMFTMDKTAFLILSLWAAGVTSSAIEKRLVSSVTCPDAERHHHVRVVYEFGDGKSMTCAGTLIHKQWVITASHCYGGRNGKLVVEIGGHPKTSAKKQMSVSDIRIYPKSPSDEPIVLLKLPEAAKDIEPAVLPAGTCTAPGDGEELQVSGRGPTTADGGERH